MRKLTTILSVCVALFGAGCEGKNEASETNFAAAMTHYFEKTGDLCLGPATWPIDVVDAERKLDFPTTNWNKMDALEAVGLVKRQDVEIDAKNVWGKSSGAKEIVRRYTLTEAAKPFAVEKEGKTLVRNETIKQTDLCWGKKTLKQIVKWEGPMALGDYQEAAVTYTYDIANRAEWSSNAAIQSA